MRESRFSNTASLAFVFTLLLLTAYCSRSDAQRGGEQPNIVIVLADDLGFSDVGCYGGEIETPSINALAENGVRFSQFYNAARCCPTRASLMTGLYPHQAGMGWMTAADMRREPYRGELSNDLPTIAEVLKTAGYATYLSGKWHLTRDDRMAEPNESWPTRRGFDRYFGTLAGSSDYYDPEFLYSGTEPVLLDDGAYLTDAITDHAVKFLQEHAETKDDSPFFLYLSYTAPHWPLQAPEGLVRKYEARYAAGWDRLRAERYARQEAAGLGGAAWPLSARDEAVDGWDVMTEKEQEELTERMAYYAAMVESMGTGLGRVVDEMGRQGVEQDTVVFFLSDNGGNWEGGPRGWNRTPTVEKYTEGSNVSYGQSWANLSNVPFREYKSRTHEGGIATPFIVHWARGSIEAGSWSAQVGHVMDLMPTCIELAGAQSGAAFEGRSLVDAIRGRMFDRGPLIWEHEANRAIRVGDWKLVAKGIAGSWELYNLAEDRSETRDLATERADKVDELAAQWEAIASRIGVLPLDGSNWFTRLRRYAPNSQ